MNNTYESERDIVAYHEAGHAVMAIACGFQITAITIDPSEIGEGYVAYHTGTVIEGEVAQKAALVSASGLVADYLLALQSGKKRLDDVFLGHFNDQDNARRYIELSGEAGSFDDYMMVAMLFLKENWMFVRTIAEALKGVSSINPDSLDLERFPLLPVDWQQRLKIAMSLPKAEDEA